MAGLLVISATHRSDGYGSVGALEIRGGGGGRKRLRQADDQIERVGWKVRVREGRPKLAPWEYCRELYVSDRTLKVDSQ